MKIGDEVLIKGCQNNRFVILNLDKELALVVEIDKYGNQWDQFWISLIQIVQT